MPITIKSNEFLNKVWTDLRQQHNSTTPCPNPALTPTLYPLGPSVDDPARRPEIFRRKGMLEYRAQVDKDYREMARMRTEEIRQGSFGNVDGVLGVRRKLFELRERLGDEGSLEWAVVVPEKLSFEEKRKVKDQGDGAGLGKGIVKQGLDARKRVVVDLTGDSDGEDGGGRRVDDEQGDSGDEKRCN